MNLLIFDSKKKLTQPYLTRAPFLKQSIDILNFTQLSRFKEAIQSAQDPSQLILLIELSTQKKAIIRSLNELIRCNHLVKAILITSDQCGYENICEEFQENCEKMGIPIIFLKSPIKKYELIEKIEYVLQLSEKLKTLSAESLLRKNHRYFHIKNPGRMLQAARENIGIDLETLSRHAIAMGYPFSLKHLQLIEADKSGKKISALEWYSLCQILELDCNIMSTGIAHVWHLRRCRHAIQNGTFYLPVTEHLKAKLMDLEKVDEEENLALEQLISVS